MAEVLKTVLSKSVEEYLHSTNYYKVEYGLSDDEADFAYILFSYASNEKEFLTHIGIIIRNSGLDAYRVGLSHPNGSFQVHF